MKKSEDLLSFAKVVRRMARQKTDVVTVHVVDCDGYTEELIYSPQIGFLHQRHAPGFCTRVKRGKP